MKQKSKKGVLIAAVLWTATTVLWAVVAFVRTFGPGSVDIMTILALLASAAVSIANWYRYANYERT